MDVLGGVGYYGDNPLAKLLISLPRYSTVSAEKLINVFSTSNVIFIFFKLSRKSILYVPSIL